MPYDKILEILTVFNAYDDRLQLTHELENNNSISLLDVLIIINEDEI